MRARRVLGPEVDVEVVGARPSDAGRPDAADARRSTTAAGPELNPKLTFDQFVIGDANRLAHAAALAVAELPGTAYNPLFIYGPPGVGKTHLLHSIANYLVTLRARASACGYTTAERFTNEFVAADPDAATSTASRARWRSNDVLLIDDVQFLESKAKTEEEFFHTFNALYDAGAQIVLTSDRLPRDLERARGPPARALRVRPGHRHRARPTTPCASRVLRKRAQQDGLELGDADVLDAIAGRVDGSVRELEGALIRVVAFASLTGRELTPDLADEVLAGLYPQAAPAPARRPPASPSSASRTSSASTSASRREELLSPAAPPASPGPARSPCTSRASTPRPACRPSAPPSAAATTRPSCTPSAGRASASQSDADATDAVRELTAPPACRQVRLTDSWHRAPNVRRPARILRPSGRLRTHPQTYDFCPFERYSS